MSVKENVKICGGCGLELSFLIMALKRFFKPANTIVPAKKKCVLKSLSKDTLDIELNNEKVFLGRSEQTGISDIFCSKKQVLVKADFTKSALSINVKGVNPSGLNGFMLEHGKGYEAYNGDIIELVYGRYPYKVNFEGAAPNNDNKQTENSSTPETVKSKEGSDMDEFESVDNGKMFVFTSKGVTASDKIASFDLDGTLIKTKSGKVFPRTLDDWQIAYAEVPGKLKSLHAQGYKIVIFTNQGGISKGKMTVKEFKLKLNSIIDKLNIPIQAFLATGISIYRKPKLGMWNYLEKHKNDGIEINKKESVYVGDAAGRLEQTLPFKVKKDHSCGDRLYAINLGLPFYTPEEYFLKKKETPWSLPEFNPKNKLPLDLLEPKTANLSTNDLEIIVMVGLPGSGKSFFARTNLQPLGYQIINRDTLGSAQACIKLCEQSLISKKSCVIDNTNIDIETRSRFISIAKTLKVNCRCFIMNVSASQLKHNIVFRELTDTAHVKISSIVFNSMKKKYTSPTLTEGFSEIVKVNVIPKFKNAEEEELYSMYLVED